jgi:outer membrane protein OmpA-like peptidoglycan-associated protein
MFIIMIIMIFDASRIFVPGVVRNLKPNPLLLLRLCTESQTSLTLYVRGKECSNIYSKRFMNKGWCASTRIGKYTPFTVLPLTLFFSPVHILFNLKSAEISQHNELMNIACHISNILVRELTIVGHTACTHRPVQPHSQDTITR